MDHMKIFIFLIGGFLMFFAESVRAEQCKFILDRCLPEEAVVINEGVKTENIFVSKRKVYRYLYSNNKVRDTVSKLELGLSYKDLQKADRELLKESFGEKCGKESCRECEEHLAYTRIDDKNFNQIQLDRVKEFRCNAVMGSVSVEPMFVYSSAKLVSQVIATSSYEYHTGGSCHSRYIFNTFNFETGNVLKLRDVIRDVGTEKLHSIINSYFLEKFVPLYAGEIKDSNEIGRAKKSLEDWLNTTDIMNSDIYVERKMLFINLDLFLFGCQRNSYFPMQIPDDLVVGL